MRQDVAAGIDDEIRCVPRSYGRLLCQHGCDEVDEIPLAAGAEIKMDGSCGDQCGAVAFDVMAPGRMGDPNPLGIRRSGFEGEIGAVPQACQGGAHAGVDRVIRRLAQPFVEVEQRFAPVRKIETAAMCGAGHRGEYRVGSEP